MVGVNDEGGAFHRQEFAEQSALDAEGLGYRAIGVGEQWVVEPLRVGEASLFGHGIGANAHARCAHRLELSGQIPEVAGLLGATRRHRGGVEEQHDRPVGQQASQ